MCSGDILNVTLRNYMLTASTLLVLSQPSCHLDNPAGKIEDSRDCAAWDDDLARARSVSARCACAR